jgi:hypothetical protein
MLLKLNEIALKRANPFGYEKTYVRNWLNLFWKHNQRLMKGLPRFVTVSRIFKKSTEVSALVAEYEASLLCGICRMVQPVLVQFNTDERSICETCVKSMYETLEL